MIPYKEVDRIVEEAQVKLSAIYKAPVIVTYRINERAQHVEELKLIMERYTGLTWEEIIKPSRSAQVVDARHKFSWICKRHLDMSYPSIAKHISKHHSTVINSVRLVDAMVLDGNDQFNAVLNSVSREIMNLLKSRK